MAINVNCTRVSVTSAEEFTGEMCSSLCLLLSLCRCHLGGREPGLVEQKMKWSSL